MVQGDALPPGEDDGHGGGAAGLRAPQVGGVGPGHGEQPGLLLLGRRLLAVHVCVVQWQFRNTRCTFSVQLATTIAAKVILKMQFLRSLFAPFAPFAPMCKIGSSNTYNFFEKHCTPFLLLHHAHR